MWKKILTHDSFAEKYKHSLKRINAILATLFLRNSPYFPNILFFFLLLRPPLAPYLDYSIFSSSRNNSESSVIIGMAPPQLS